MICKPCRLAADVQTELQDKVSKKRWVDVQMTAVALHKNCKDCDCQHKLVEPGKNVQSANLS